MKKNLHTTINEFKKSKIKFSSINEEGPGAGIEVKTKLDYSVKYNIFETEDGVEVKLIEQDWDGDEISMLGYDDGSRGLSSNLLKWENNLTTDKILDIEIETDESLTTVRDLVDETPMDLEINFIDILYDGMLFAGYVRGDVNSGDVILDDGDVNSSDIEIILKKGQDEYVMNDDVYLIHPKALATEQMEDFYDFAFKKGFYEFMRNEIENGVNYPPTP